MTRICAVLAVKTENYETCLGRMNIAVYWLKFNFTTEDIKTQSNTMWY